MKGLIVGNVVVVVVVVVQLSLLSFSTVLGGDIDVEAASAPSHSPYSQHPHPAMSPSHSHPPSTHHHHHHHAHPPAPSHAPTYPPMHPPMAHSHLPPPPKPLHHPSPPPLITPLPPRFHFPRSFVAVQGVVYCKSCKYAGVDTLLGATPLLGATVKLKCNNTKYPQEVKATTDKNGYFFLEAPKTITNYGAHKCKAFLVPSSSSSSSCGGKPSNLHGGVVGGVLRPEKRYVAKKLPFVLFNVGPFAFERNCTIN